LNKPKPPASKTPQVPEAMPVPEVLPVPEVPPVPEAPPDIKPIGLPHVVFDNVAYPDDITLLNRCP